MSRIIVLFFLLSFSFCSVYLEGTAGTKQYSFRMGINNAQVKQWISILNHQNERLINISFINPMDDFWISYGSYLESELTLAGGIIEKGTFYKNSGIIKWSPLKDLNLTSALLDETLFYQFEIKDLLKIMALSKESENILGGELGLTILGQKIIGVWAYLSQLNHNRIAYGLLMDGRINFANLMTEYKLAGLIYEGSGAGILQTDNKLYSSTIHKTISDMKYGNASGIIYCDFKTFFHSGPVQPYLQGLVSLCNGEWDKTYRIGILYQIVSGKNNMSVDIGYGTLLGMFSNEEKGIELCINTSVLF